MRIGKVGSLYTTPKKIKPGQFFTSCLSKPQLFLAVARPDTGKTALLPGTYEELRAELTPKMRKRLKWLFADAAKNLAIVLSQLLDKNYDKYGVPGHLLEFVDDIESDGEVDPRPAKRAKHN